MVDGTGECQVTIPVVFPHIAPCPHVCLSGGRRPAAVTSRNPVCHLHFRRVWWRWRGSLSALLSLKTQTPGFRSQAALFGRTHDTWVWALHADTLRGDMPFLPKALRSSQAPEWGAQALPRSGTQPFVVPGTPGVSAKPLGLKQEGWAPVRSLHGLEQGAQE